MMRCPCLLFTYTTPKGRTKTLHISQQALSYYSDLHKDGKAAPCHGSLVYTATAEDAPYFGGTSAELDEGFNCTAVNRDSEVPLVWIVDHYDLQSLTEAEYIDAQTIINLALERFEPDDNFSTS